MSPLLRVDNLSWAPPGQDAPLFAGVTFEVDAGERAVLRGASGAGKSTLLRCIAGLEPRRSGAVWWRGDQLGPETMRRFRNRAVYVHQRPSAIAETVGENLAFARQMAAQFGHADHSLDPEAQREMFVRLGLADIGLERRFDELSIGEQQRVCLVRALTGQPDMLLLDEPTSALDPERVEQIEDLLMGYVDEAADRRAYLWVSHHPAEIERVASRVLDIGQWTGGGS